MMDNPPESKSRSKERTLLWVSLLLEVVILGWLAKNHFDGAFGRRSHNPSAVQVSDLTPPSLVSTPTNAPSSLSSAETPATPTPHWMHAGVPPLLRMRHPAGRMRAEMQQMMAQANAAMQADLSTLFSPGPAWAGLPASPAMNMHERTDGYELSLAMPDVPAEALDVRLDGRLLTISFRQDTHTPHASASQHFGSRLLLPGPVDEGRPIHLTNENNRIYIRIAKPVSPPKPVEP
ncbi:MAG: Hsp20/alpha crystallin family protein [Verrucomicrobiota bacterium]|jgi:HSP20 family molecular chaperone IbpA|nr:Hsp20/alpha crystallin family protein [Verrucomicrobiota bacterium]